MNIAQSGIFAFGTASHANCEFGRHAGQPPGAVISATADVREPRTTTVGDGNVVAGFPPERWRGPVSDERPGEVVGFNQDLVGADGFVMPGAQHDAILWPSGSSYDVVFDEARQAITALAALASLADETSSWPYRRFRELTGLEIRGV